MFRRACQGALAARKPVRPLPRYALHCGINSSEGVAGYMGNIVTTVSMESTRFYTEFLQQKFEMLLTIRTKPAILATGEFRSARNLPIGRTETFRRDWGSSETCDLLEIDHRWVRQPRRGCCCPATAARRSRSRQGADRALHRRGHRRRARHSGHRSTEGAD